MTIINVRNPQGQERLALDGDALHIPAPLELSKRTDEVAAIAARMRTKLIARRGILVKPWKLRSGLALGVLVPRDLGGDGASIHDVMKCASSWGAPALRRR